MVFGFGKKKKFSFSCASVGMNCEYEIRNAGSEEELLEMLKVHAKRAHGINEIPAEMVEKIKANIKKS